MLFVVENSTSVANIIRLIIISRDHIIDSAGADDSDRSTGDVLAL